MQQRRRMCLVNVRWPVAYNRTYQSISVQCYYGILNSKEPCVRDRNWGDLVLFCANYTCAKCAILVFHNFFERFWIFKRPYVVRESIPNFRPKNTYIRVSLNLICIVLLQVSLFFFNAKSAFIIVKIIYHFTNFRT